MFHALWSKCGRSLRSLSASCWKCGLEGHCGLSRLEPTSTAFKVATWTIETFCSCCLYSSAVWVERMHDCPRWPWMFEPYESIMNLCHNPNNTSPCAYFPEWFILHPIQVFKWGYVLQEEGIQPPTQIFPEDRKAILFFQNAPKPYRRNI